MAAQEREKQEKKAARKAAKVSNPTFPGPARSPIVASRTEKITFFFPTHNPLTAPHPTPPPTTRQEAKREERLAREEFALTGGNKKLTKKERKRLELDE